MPLREREEVQELLYVEAERVLSWRHERTGSRARGVLLDCFGGSGTILAAGLDFGASQMIGIEQQKKYVKISEKRIVEG